MRYFGMSVRFHTYLTYLLTNLSNFYSYVHLRANGVVLGKIFHRFIEATRIYKLICILSNSSPARDGLIVLRRGVHLWRIVLHNWGVFSRVDDFRVYFESIAVLTFGEPWLMDLLYEYLRIYSLLPSEDFLAESFRVNSVSKYFSIIDTYPFVWNFFRNVVFVRQFIWKFTKICSYLHISSV